jgi:hypothetical protein
MLPPIPQALIPVTTQHDSVKPRPDIAPVTAVAHSKEAGFQSVLDEQKLEQESEKRRKRKRALQVSLPDERAEALMEPSEKGQCVDIKV